MKATGAFLAGILGLVSMGSSAKADIFLSFSTGADYLQVSPFRAVFRGGDLAVRLRDGLVILAPCADHPSPVLVPPNLFCPLGTTGFIAAGDADGDGVRDDLSFWSISDVIPAIFIEPFREQLAVLSSAPPSKLPRPLGPFSDQGLVVFYNVLTANVLQYNITLYEFLLEYPEGAAGRKVMEEQIVIGNYVFGFPRLRLPEQRVNIPVTYLPLPEAVDVTARYPDGGFKYTSGRWDDNGFYLMDPRVTNKITWEGNDPSIVHAGSDVFRLAILDASETDVLFPPSQTPLLLPNPFTHEYFLPPFFFEVGDVGVFQIRLDRFLGTSAVAFDTSVRLYNFNLRFVDSYPGFRQVTFPPGSLNIVAAAGRDFDGDDQSNILEFGMQSDPTDATSLGVFPVAVQEADGRVSFTQPKRPDAAIRYEFLVSTNGGEFEKVTSKSESWNIVVDDEFELRIESQAVADAASFTSTIEVREIILRIP